MCVYIYIYLFAFKDISKAAEDDTAKAECAGKEHEGDKEKTEAATKIQAAFRGHHARKSLRVPESASDQGKTEEATSPEPTKEQLEEEFSSDNRGEGRLERKSSRIHSQMRMNKFSRFACV